MSVNKEKEIKENVKTIAASQRRSFNEVWRQVILERLLVRLHRSPYREKLIFKGGMCLSYYLSLGRETKDLDFLLRGLNANESNLKNVFEEICAISVDDGFVFDAVTVGSLAHKHMKYPGYEIKMKAVYGSMRTHLHIDIGIGDQVKPENLTIELAESNDLPLFEKEIDLWAYSPEYIFAEKYETAIRREAVNSRMKDYQDLVVLIQSSILDSEKLRAALDATFKNRKTSFSLIPNYEKADIERLENYWTSYLRLVKASQNEYTLPQSFHDVVQIINTWVQEVYK